MGFTPYYGEFAYRCNQFSLKVRFSKASIKRSHVLSVDRCKSSLSCSNRSINDLRRVLNDFFHIAYMAQSSGSLHRIVLICKIRYRNSDRLYFHYVFSHYSLSEASKYETQRRPSERLLQCFAIGKFKSHYFVSRLYVNLFIQ